jgi:hypothetical protein
MSPYDPRSWLDKLVGACVSVVVCAAAIYIAVRLIQAVAAVLLVIVSVGALLAIAAALVLRRDRGW